MRPRSPAELSSVTDGGDLWGRPGVQRGVAIRPSAPARGGQPRSAAAQPHSQSRHVKCIICGWYLLVQLDCSRLIRAWLCGVRRTTRNLYVEKPSDGQMVGSGWDPGCWCGRWRPSNLTMRIGPMAAMAMPQPPRLNTSPSRKKHPYVDFWLLARTGYPL